MQRAPVSDLYKDRRLPRAGCTLAAGPATTQHCTNKTKTRGLQRDSGDTDHATTARGRTQAGDLVIETAKPYLVL